MNRRELLLATLSAAALAPALRATAAQAVATPSVTSVDPAKYPRAWKVQRSTTVFHAKRSGQRIYRALSWQDVRTSETVDSLQKKAFFSKRFPVITGLRLMPHFAATKIAWAIREHGDVKRAAMAGDLYASTLDAYLVRRLTEGAVYSTDSSMAAVAFSQSPESASIRAWSFSIRARR